MSPSRDRAEELLEQLQERAQAGGRPVITLPALELQVQALGKSLEKLKSADDVSSILVILNLMRDSVVALCKLFGIEDATPPRGD